MLKKRSTYELPWLFELVDFAAYKNKRVLELGCGAGYDAYEFCRNGVEYTGIDLVPGNIARTKKHLSFYGLKSVVLEGDAENLVFGDENFDLVFSNGVLHHTPDIKKSLKEAYRVLKSGGGLVMIIYHKNSIFYWISLFFFDHIFRLGFLKRTFKQRLSMIEHTTSKANPLVTAFSRSELKKIIKSVGFHVKKIKVRKLVKEDLPGIPLVSRSWDKIPQPALDHIGKIFGWYIIAKATKE